MDAITDGVISNDDARDKRQELDTKQSQLQTDLAAIASELESVPTQKSLKRLKALPTKRRLIIHETAFEDMQFDESRALVEIGVG